MGAVVALVLGLIGWCTLVVFTTWLVWTTLFVLRAREDRRLGGGDDRGGSRRRT